MQELILWAQVPAHKHEIVLSVLAGIAGLQPSPLAERHLLFRPRRPVGTPAGRDVLKRAKELRIPEAFITTQYHIQAVGNIAAIPRKAADKEIPNSMSVGGTQATSTRDPDAAAANGGRPETESATGGGDAMVVDGTKDGQADQSRSGKAEGSSSSTATTTDPRPQDDWLAFPWTVEFREFPVKPPQAGSAAGQAPERQRQGLERASAVATQRSMWNSDVPADTSPLAFLDGLDFRFVSEHVLAGHRLTHKDIDLRLFRVYGVVPASDVGAVPGAPPSTATGSALGATPIPRMAIDPRERLAGSQQPPLQIVLPHAANGNQDLTDGDAGAGGEGRRQLKAVDSSGTYLLQARLAIADSDPKLKKEGESQMRELADKLRGFVDLKLGAYLQMDTRILVRQDG